MNGSLILAIVLGSPVLAYLLGSYFGRALRMKDHGWRIGLILATFALGTCITVFYWPPKLGIDLSGGVILVYEVDEERSSSEAESAATEGGGSGQPAAAVDMGAVVQALTLRINPTGVSEVVIREYGAKQIEIIIPNVGENEIDEIKRKIVKSGYLKFQIVANPQDHAHIIELANLQKNSDNPIARQARQVREGNLVVAEWVPIGVEPNRPEGEPTQYRVEVDERVSREIDGQRQALMVVDTEPDLRVDGSHLRSVATGFDNLSPCVNFRMTMQGATLFGALTGSNLPDKQSGVYRLLGVVMDDELISAPRIMSRITDDGQITGRFTQEEVDFLVDVLRAGRLPAVLKDEPISENTISPLLGIDTIRKGAFAIGISLVAVLVFMLIYYHFSGIVACMALIMNLVLILALMILISAAFTLPGLAGLVLTVGMSVDANVLIFERIREELNRGAALRMAIRNGFGRATTTIVDANLTTLITAVVLYVIGTDQIRGFAVTLILGILISMFTAIFCSRVVFDIAERKKWITRLTMLHILGQTKIDFVGKRKFAAVLSIMLIAIGLFGAGARGKRIFDIDFLGGTSVQPVFKAPIPIEQVRQMASDLADDVSVTQVDTEGYEKGRIYKIDTSLERVEDLEQQIAQTFQENGASMLVTRDMSFTTPEEFSPDAAGEKTDREPATDQTSQTSGSAKSIVSRVVEESRIGREPLLLAMADQASPGENSGEADVTDQPASDQAAAEPALEQPGDQSSQPSTDADTGLGAVVDPTDAAAPQNEQAAEPQPSSSGLDEQTADTATEEPEEAGATGATLSQQLLYRTQADVTFSEKMSDSALGDRIESVALALEMTPPEVAVEPLDDGDDGKVMHRVRFSSDLSDTTKILKEIQSGINGTPYVLSASTIGGAVADKTTNLAIAALGTSLLGIVAYIWIRFQRVVYGLAAVVALLHDVAFTIGAVGVSFWLSHVFGFLLIDEFKISLPVVAALLTIIGYSLNDTIVVFDRIREVKGKSPELTGDMINTSINQTLSRTVLTSTTTLLVVGILYAFGGQGIHGFAFALLIGVMVGTYSSIFVASPALLWMSQKWAPAATRRNAARST